MPHPSKADNKVMAPPPRRSPRLQSLPIRLKKPLPSLPLSKVQRPRLVIPKARKVRPEPSFVRRSGRLHFTGIYRSLLVAKPVGLGIVFGDRGSDPFRVWEEEMSKVSKDEDNASWAKRMAGLGVPIGRVELRYLTLGKYGKVS